MKRRNDGCHLTLTGANKEGKKQWWKYLIHNFNICFVVIRKNSISIRKSQIKIWVSRSHPANSNPGFTEKFNLTTSAIRGLLILYFDSNKMVRIKIHFCQQIRWTPGVHTLII